MFTLSTMFSGILLEIVIFNVIIFIVGLIYVLRYLNHSFEQKKYNDSLENNAQTVLEDAQNEATKIIQHAVEQSTQMLVESKESAQKIDSTFNRHIEQIGIDQEAAFEDFMVKMHSQNMESLKAVSLEFREKMHEATSVMKEEAKGSLGEFNKLFSSEIQEVYAKIHEKFEESMVGVEKQVEEYRLDQLKKVDDHVEAKVVEKVQLLVKKIVTPSLSETERETLIRNNIQKAKKDNVFN
ncbi:hypothetical protein COX05_00640 [candidate division WWE3 bacterium CG22_combo_CG10-13_8_21_14_all_39_12]|uniref:ATP synthase subunit b n=2 Tax=Katanobacteria TaxID=422282 RepID=A0A2M7X447_UNCKA|nr:MAG: hypothetical protein COX05_00640 [candidate division WWE3 bacterium CG22_combo_CG10-13_8_21_14_all_39_12]PJA40899.1 MAG: hypothetical protein CO179_01065 [candidate division WWE3 bacterium CG_4_9_14_3_um_filter_39_7]